MKNNRHAAKLSPAEARNLEQFTEKHGGQIAAGALFGVSPATISRNVNRHTSPSPMLRKALVENGIIKQK
jgi:hypothetical protein